LTYTVAIKRSAEKEMESLPREVHRRVTAKIISLEMNPRPAGIRKLQGTEGYRLRVGDYRILYTVDDRSHTVVIYSVAHRREAYR
jgi:mRNA interferase RelE/StbE